MSAYQHATYVVRLSFDNGSSWSDVTDRARDKDFSRTRQLHNADSEPVQDKVQFTLTSDAALAFQILSQTSSDRILVDITRDGAAWFHGYARPVTQIKIDEEDNTISFEALDNSWRLLEAFDNDVLIENINVVDTSTTSNSLIYRLLTDSTWGAGYDVSEVQLDFDVSIAIPAFSPDPEKSYREIINELCYAYGLVYYFDEAGRFRLYRWRGDDTITTVGTVDEDNVVGKLEVSIDEADPKSYRVTYYGVEWRNDVRLLQKTKGSTGQGYLDSGYTGFGSNYLNDTYDKDYPIDESKEEILQERNHYMRYNVKDAWWVDEYFTYSKRASHCNGWFTHGDSWCYSPYAGAIITDFDADAGRDNQAYMRVGVNTSPTFYSGDLKPHVKFGGAEVRGDILVKSEGGTVTVPNPSVGEIEQFDNGVVYGEAEAAKLAEALYNRNEFGRYLFKFDSLDDYSLGDYVTISSTALNTTVDCRIVKKRYEEKRLGVISYEARAASELQGLATIVTDSNVETITEDDAEVIVSNSFDENGQPTGPIANTDMVGVPLAQAPGELSLESPAVVITGQGLGMYDGTQWSVVIANDGTWKFVGDGSNYIEWDGSKLHIEGDLFLSGDSELRGTVTTGNGIQSDNYAAGSAGWQIDGDGNAEFRSGNIGGWILDQVLKSAASGRRIELDPTNNRVAIFDDTEVTVVQGYLDGLPKNDGSGDWGPTDYGFWARQGDRLRIDGTVEQVNGDWILDKDSSFLLSQVDPDATPFNGARRLRFGANEIGVDEYAGGSWIRRVTIDASSGVKTHTVRGTNALLLYAGDYSDVVQDGYSVGRSVPSGGEAYRFETTYTDLVAGDDEWTTKQNLEFTTDCRYGEHAITGDGASGAELARGPWEGLNLNGEFDLEWWFKLSSTTTADYTPLWSAMAGERGMRLGILALLSEYGSDSYAAGYWEASPTDYTGKMQLSAWYGGRWEYLMLDVTTETWRYLGLTTAAPGEPLVVFDNSHYGLSGDGKPPASGPVAYYPLDGDATDASGNGNDGTQSGGITYVDGIAGRAARFDGVDDYVSIPETTLSKDGASVSGWFYIDDFTAHIDRQDQVTILCQEDTGTYRWMGFGDGLFEMETDTNRDGGSISDAGIVEGSWFHAVITFDGGTVSLYINGVKSGSAFAIDDDLTVTNIGRAMIDSNYQSGYPSWFDGLIDEVRIYDYALSEAEISELYQYRPARWSVPAEPTLTWHMDPGPGQIVDMLYVNTESAGTVSDILDRGTDEVGFGSIDNDQKLVMYAKNGLIVGAPIIDGLTVESGGIDVQDGVVAQHPSLSSALVINGDSVTSGAIYAAIVPYVPSVGDTVLIRGAHAEKVSQYMTKIENWMLAERNSSTQINLYGWEHTQSTVSDPVDATAGVSRAVSEGSSSVVGDVFLAIG